VNSYRERIARAIHEECSDSSWPDGGTVEQRAERDHWFACADRAIEAMRDGDDSITLEADGELLAAVAINPRTGGVELQINDGATAPYISLLPDAADQLALGLMAAANKIRRGIDGHA